MMKILQYSQHIWGVGHFFRSLELCKALKKHQVILVSGGDHVDTILPEHVRTVRLAGIRTGQHYKQLLPVQEGMSLEHTQQARRQKLLKLYADEHPDILIIEFYPFGRNAFRFELEPLLQGIRQGDLPPTFVVCSIRDILVEKQDPAYYESRVLKRLNRYFHALLVHSDPRVMQLDETFRRVKDIAVPIVYTGFVTPKPAPEARIRHRTALEIGDQDRLIVASAGGGKSGAPLLRAVLEAFRRADFGEKAYLFVFTGPYINEADFDDLARNANDRITVSRFSYDFLSFLAAADLSVSMAGYNTCMNILASQVNALVWPFAGDREQGLRAHRLVRLGAVRMLDDSDLVPHRLAEMLQTPSIRKPMYTVDLNGAGFTARWLEEQQGGKIVI